MANAAAVSTGFPGLHQVFSVVPHISDSVIVDYWDERASSYSCCVCGELEGEKYADWARVLEQHSAVARRKAESAGRVPRVLDLGCGPGFFSILFARMACKVDAVDSSDGMLKQAYENNRRAHTVQNVAFHNADIAKLPFADDTFDVVVLRNVTWLMTDPRSAYEEWQRVLVPGGKLMVFDANWYHYLVNPVVDAQRLLNEAAVDFERVEVNGYASDDQETRCEEIALALPSTYLARPGWDVEALGQLGFAHISLNEDVWQTVWTEEEQSFYGASPLFLIEATK